MPATLTLKAKVSGPCVVCGHHAERELALVTTSLNDAQNKFHALTHHSLLCPLCADPAETAFHREY